MKQKYIAVICPYPEHEAPSQRLKYEQYFHYFRDAGFDIKVHSFFSKKYFRSIYRDGNILGKSILTLFGYVSRFLTIFRLPFYDGVYIHLNVTPFGTSLFERLYRLFSRKLIYDIDDLVFLGKSSEQNKFLSFLRGRSKYDYIMRVADHVITCTPHLDKHVRQFNPNTTDISSTINTDTYVPVNRYKNDSGPVTLGWSGSFTTGPYLKLLEPVFRKLSQKYRFKILAIGASSDLKIEGCEVIPWIEATEVRDLQRIDIGLYPLPDEEWVYGKSGLKALQYMALGIPTVATAIGANFRVIEDGVSGFLVKKEEEWVDRLSRLIEDANLRQRLGMAARKRVENLYSIHANAPTYLKIFREVYGEPK